MSQESKSPHNESMPQEYAEYLKRREKIGGYITAAYLIACVIVFIVGSVLLLGR